MSNDAICYDGPHGCERGAPPHPQQPELGAQGSIKSVVLEFEGVAVMVTLDHEGPGWAPWIDLTTGFRYGQTLRGGFVRVE